jgi:FdhD protein
MTTPTRAVDIVRVCGRERVAARDRAAAEEPLAIRLHGEPYAVIMRTPGADRDLAAGFLFAERLIRRRGDLTSIEYCADAVERENVVDVTLADRDRVLRARAQRRTVVSTAACGICGRQSIEDLASDLDRVDSDVVVASATIARLPQRLRASQRAFDETGALHAAGVFSVDGDLLDIAEDVGRHNTVDKVIGRAVLHDRIPLSHAVLCVSGRTSFEIVQKAAVAGIPVLAAVSAPSSLAIDLAARAGITLVGFVRGDTFNIYATPDRIV